MWCLAPFYLDTRGASVSAGVIFGAAVGLFFPATVTLLIFESNQRLGPAVADAIFCRARGAVPMLREPFRVERGVLVMV